MIFCAGTYSAALPITAATSSGVSMRSVATSMAPTSTSLPSSSFSTLIRSDDLLRRNIFCRFADHRGDFLGRFDAVGGDIDGADQHILAVEQFQHAHQIG